MAPPTDYPPIVQELKNWIVADGERQSRFNEAISTAKEWHIEELGQIQSLEDYFRFLHEQLIWVPSDSVLPKDIQDRIMTFFFIMDQPAVKDYQNPVTPSDKDVPLTWLSGWFIRFAQELGNFLDTPESITPESLAKFKASDRYSIDDYLEPRLGWRSFNDFFARILKPGRRPIADIGDPTVIVSPTDSTFDGYFKIGAASTVLIKGVEWKISQLLAEGRSNERKKVEINGSGSIPLNTDGRNPGNQNCNGNSHYSERFGNGVWMHMYLGPFDYHRMHAPIGGTVLDARVIPGLHYLQVIAEPISAPTDGEKIHYKMNVPNELGYQFVHTRGLIVLETPVGLVAVIGVGMAHVASVIIAAEVGATVHKGELLAYFQFGGSDVVVLFEEKEEVRVTAQIGEHYKMGEKLGNVWYRGY